MIALNALSRLCAVPCQAKDILCAESISTESGQTFFRSATGMVSRIAFTGLLVGKEDATGLIDDGTGQILLRAGDPQTPLPELPLGAIVFCIGRIRNVGPDRYISVESIKQLHDTAWLTYRKAEVALFRAAFSMQQPSQKEPIPRNQAEPTPAQGSQGSGASWRDRIIATIKLLDAGDGAELSIVLAQVGETDDERIRALIKQGDIYEHRPGRIKILD